MNAPTPIGRRRTARQSASFSIIAVLAMVATGSAASATTFAPSPGEAAQVDAAGASERSVPEEPWRWPVPAPIRVVAPFRAPPTPYTAGHRGIDIASAPAASVVAPAPGVVSFAGMVAGRPVIAIDHGDGVVSAIEPVAALVEAGASVTAGDPIGTVSMGGHCASGCVHFGVRVDGEYVSPYLFLGGLPRAVLLPSG
ncbi:murein DD-endopeptidase MepM/ murein hydrolase activator NlpD [Agromyces cerinus]|uniref:M23 family metallopeptidase n=1 Tax=Agromyces cerinus TaxID=33878 RepID=UPI0019592113|nr:M23 family metallopeptidase [Agromyces cerinus]MBM7830261.1 murein DD-endopeptidase MepM/ murein hydrolase activator NlpD [Agromyces cerinus]